MVEIQLKLVKTASLSSILVEILLKLIKIQLKLVEIAIDRQIKVIIPLKLVKTAIYRSIFGGFNGIDRN